MTEPCLTRHSLVCLERCYEMAAESFTYYECLYDEADDSPDRDILGRAMAQKQDFMSATAAIFKNHDFKSSKLDAPVPANDCRQTLKGKSDGAHLEHEESFLDTMRDCMLTIHDDTISELLEHHLDAAQIALKAIKGSSLKI